MKYSKLEGIIINRQVVKDSDRFLTIFTKEMGKISVYARGIRSITSKRGSQLDLFSHIKFELIEQHDRRTLTSVELLDGHHVSKDKLENISRLFQIGELIDALLPEDDPHPDVYALLKTALTHLHRFATPDYLYRFKKKLLLLLGYGNFENRDIDVFIDSLLMRPLRARITL
ncbi:MAG: DNA repair protein RecO [bacterium]